MTTKTALSCLASGVTGEATGDFRTGERDDFLLDSEGCIREVPYLDLPKKAIISQKKTIIDRSAVFCLVQLRLLR